MRWPAPADGSARERPLRLLAVSDQTEESLKNPATREALSPVDVIIGAGDLDPEYLAMLADSFHAPLLYVLGNHDRGSGWEESEDDLPSPMADARVERLRGVDIAGLSWPGDRKGRAAHDDWAAWRQVIRLGLSRSKRRPLILVSHVPPQGAGDDPSDPYHRGFGAYRWLANQLRPALWLHGHTSVATQASQLASLGGTQLLNVTGGVLIELDPWPAAAPGRSRDAEGRHQAATSSTTSGSSASSALVPHAWQWNS